MTDDLERDIREAQLQHDQDIEQLGEMTYEELDYLARVQELEDPLTDGVECDADTRAYRPE